MKILRTKILLGTFLAGILAACSAGDTTHEAPVQGTITVADSIDSSGDYSGIGIAIIKKDSANANADTLFNAETNAKGKFSGVAEFTQRRQYRMLVSRSGRNLGQTGVILAPNDTIKISAQLPDFAQTFQINSKEHNALVTYRRAEKGFNRVNAFARAGRLQGDSLARELKKWPDIYWQIYEENSETLAGNLSAKKTIELLNGWDEPAMMQKIRQIQTDTDLAYLAATYGTNYLAHTQGLDYSLAYLDTLESQTAQPAHMRIQMERINLLYDSARVDRAGALLEEFSEEYEEDKYARQWAESIRYDLNYLSPGDAIPEFSFMADGKEISREKLKGSSYILEITSLKSPVYQRQYNRTSVIYGIYKNYNFQIITIPLDTSQVTIDAFYQERPKSWPVAPADAFDIQNVREKFNIKTVPTRFLVDQQGRITRRYIGREYNDVIQGIQQVMNKDKNL